MKKIMIAVVAALSLTSCGNNQVQTMASDGSVGWADNNVNLDVKVGDTLVIDHTISRYGTTARIKGYYKGVVAGPSNFSYPDGKDTVTVFSHETVEVVIKK